MEPDRASVEKTALRMLRLRDHLSGELRTKLSRKGYPGDLINEVLERFEEWGYLNDKSVAARYVESLVNKRFGPQRIREKLLSRGLGGAEADQAVAPWDDHAGWRERATAQLRSKFRTEPARMDQKERGRAYRHLLGRGFSPDVARSVLLD